MELLKETALLCWIVVPATAAFRVPQGHSHPGVPVQCKVTTRVSIPAAFLVFNRGNKSRTFVCPAGSLADCKEI